MTATVLAPEPVEHELARLVAAFDEPFWSEAGWSRAACLRPSLPWVGISSACS